MRLRDAGVDLEQPDLVDRLVPEVLDVERRVVVADVLHDALGDQGHLALHPLRKLRGVLVAKEADHLGVADRVDDAGGDHLALVGIALERALTATDDLLRNAVAAADFSDLRRQLELVEDVVEGLGDRADLGPEGLNGAVEVLRTVHAEAQPRSG